MLYTKLKLAPFCSSCDALSDDILSFFDFGREQYKVLAECLLFFFPVCLLLLQLRSWLVALGSTLCIAVILAKIWRVNFIFSDLSAKKNVRRALLSIRLSVRLTV